MQTVSAEILLAGSLSNTVIKSGLSVPEVAIILHEHGIGSVRRIKIDGKDNRTTAAERERLASVYGEDTVQKLFPGAMPQLPRRLEDIGLKAIDDEKPSKQEEA